MLAGGAGVGCAGSDDAVGVPLFAHFAQGGGNNEGMHEKAWGQAGRSQVFGERPRPWPAAAKAGIDFDRCFTRR